MSKMITIEEDTLKNVLDSMKWATRSYNISREEAPQFYKVITKLSKAIEQQTQTMVNNYKTHK